MNVSNFDLVMESDMGTFTPVGLQFTGSRAAQKVRLKAKLENRTKILTELLFMHMYDTVTP